MVQTNGQSPRPEAPVTSPLDTAIEAYDKAIFALEQAQAEATFEQKVAVLVARDGVEKKRQMDQNPQGETYAKLLLLDKRLRGLAESLNEDDELTEWKDSVNAAPNMWWWHLKYPLIQSPSKANNRYQQAIYQLESSLPNPSSNEIIEVLLARDAVEESRNNQPLPENVAKTVIKLDERLKVLAAVIDKEGKLEDWKKSLAKTTQDWWWELSSIEPQPAQAVQRYENALNALESPDTVSSEELLEVLIARDAVEKAWDKQQQQPRNLTAKLVDLDKRLKAQAKVFANNDIVDEWKNNLKPPEKHWWWSFTRPTPLPNQALKRYSKAIDLIESNSPPTSEQLLEALLSRDEVEEAIQEAYQEKPVPEKLAREIIALDNKLKKYRLDLNKDNQLRQWKNSLKRQNRWWWELKPAIVGSEEEPGTRKDWLFNTLAVVCLGFGAAFTIYTTQVFFQKVEGQETQKADLSQNLAAVLQVVGLGAGGAAALTKGGRQSLEKLFTTLRLPPQKQAPTALAIAAGIATITGTVAASLPLWGKNYLNDGEKHIQAAEWLKARNSFIQAKKFISSHEDKAKAEIGLGKSYEYMTDLTKAKEHYEKAAAFDNLEGMARFARMNLVEFFLKNPPTSRTQPSASDENLRKAHLYNERAWLKIFKGLNSDKQTPGNVNRKRLQVTQMIMRNRDAIGAIDTLIVNPINDVFKDQNERSRLWRIYVVGILRQNLQEMIRLKIPKDDPLYVKADCFVRVTDLSSGKDVETIRGYLKDVPGFDPQDGRSVNCYGDEVLNVYEFAFTEALTKMYKLPKYTGVASPNLRNNNQPGTNLRNNNQPGTNLRSNNQPETYNPNYSSQ